MNFFNLFQRLIKYNGLKAISDSLLRDSYSIKKCGISDLRHFLYKSKSTAQYTSPELEAPYLTADQQERLFGLYHYLHHRIHSSARPLKILYHVGQYETLLGWVRLIFLPALVAHLDAHLTGDQLVIRRLRVRFLPGWHHSFMEI